VAARDLLTALHSTAHIRTDNSACGPTMPGHRFTIALGVVAFVSNAACGRNVSPSQPSPTTRTSSFAVRGAVREKLPDGTIGLPIRGSRVEVVGKPGVVVSVVTDDAGRYSISNLGGSFEMRVSRNGFETSTFAVGPVREDVTLDVAIPPILRTLRGFVLETPPTETTPVPGARVEIVTGSNKGLSATTDETGAYSINDVWGEFDIFVTQAHFQTQTSHVLIEADGARTDTHISPVPRVIQETYSQSCCGFPFSTIVFAVHNPGDIVVTDVASYGFEQGDTSLLEVLEEGRVIAQTFVERSFPRKRLP
jgi:Carboxypeptidase regulatory-like domain